MTNHTCKYLEKTLFCFFVLFIFSSTFSIALAQISLGVSLILFLIFSIVMRYNPFVSSLKWFYLFVALYIIWMFLSALIGSSPLKSALIIKEEWLFCVIPIGVFLFDRQEYRNKLVSAFAMGVLLVSIYGIIQHFTGIHWFKATPPKTATDFGYLACGGFSNPLTFGNYFGTAALFLIGYAFMQKKKLSKLTWLFFVSTSLFSTIATVLSYSRGVIIGLAVALVILGLIAGRRYLLFSLVAIVVIVAAIVIFMPGLTARFSGKTEKDLGGVYEGGRVFVWKNSIKVIQKNPVFGVGQGNFQAAYSTYLRPDIPEKRKLTHAHNDLLNVAAISGIPGAVFFLGMWVAAISYFWKIRQTKTMMERNGSYALAALLASIVFFVTSLFEATFADEEVRQLLMFIWAAGLWPLYKNTKRENTLVAKNA